MNHSLSRRQLLAGSAATAVACSTSSVPVASATGIKPLFSYCLNTSTIREQGLPIDQEIKLAAKVGYHGVEPWIRELVAYKESGGKLSDLKKLIADSGMTVDSAIGFARWVVNDDAERKKGFEDAKRDMDLVAQIGGTRIAAPPMGMHKAGELDLLKAAERYRDLIELGEEFGVVPMVETWGSARNMSRLGEAVFIAIESGHPNACMLPDVYHMYRGGSDHGALHLLSAEAIPVCHVNDYPDMPREEMKDADRVYPGDGVAPVAEILKLLGRPGSKTALSLELFNRDYWKQDAEKVLATGLAKMKAAVTQV